MTLDKEENAKPPSPGAQLRERIIKRAALEFQDGMYGILTNSAPMYLPVIGEDLVSHIYSSSLICVICKFPSDTFVIP